MLAFDPEDAHGSGTRPTTEWARESLPALLNGAGVPPRPAPAHVSFGYRFRLG